MKTYVLTVSRVFPVTHKRKGEFTQFEEQVRFGLGGYNLSKGLAGKKIHTIRANFDFWDKRIREVQAGNAVLSVRYWSGKPYNSKQVEICQLNKDSGIGVQMIELDPFGINYKIDGKEWVFNEGETLAKNDGLSFEDFSDWFRKYDLSKPMVIIHFTSFRY